MISNCAKIIVLSTVTVAIVVSITLNILFHRELFLQGVQFIIDYQRHGKNGFVTVVYNLFSILGQTYFVVVLLGLVYIIAYRKMQVSTYISMIMFSVYLVSIGKQAWHEPRPYWYSPDIQPLQWQCPSQYGHPSGHSMISIVIYQPLVVDFFGSGPFYILLIIPILTGMFIPLSRMYLGAHSVNQISMGLLFSFICVILYRYFFIKIMYQKVYWKLLSRAVQTKCYRIKLLLGTAIIQVAIFMAPIIIYLVNINLRSVNQAEIDRYNHLCRKQATYQSIEGDAMGSNAVIGLLFGIIYGIAFLNLGDTNKKEDSQNKNINQGESQRKHKQIHQKRVQENPQINYVYGQFLTGNWKYGKLSNFFKLLLIIAVSAGIPGGICIGLIPAVVKNAYVDYIFETLGFTLVGAALYSIVPVLGYNFEAYITQSMDKDEPEQEAIRQKDSKNDDARKNATSINVLNRNQN